MLNRSSIIVRPKQPYLDWVASYDGTSIPASEVQQDQTVYLIPEYLDELDAHQVLKQVYETIFELELEGWCLNEEKWPVPGRSRFSRNGSRWNATPWSSTSAAIPLIDEGI